MVVVVQTDYNAMDTGEHELLVSSVERNECITLCSCVRLMPGEESCVL